MRCLISLTWLFVCSLLVCHPVSAQGRGLWGDAARLEQIRDAMTVAGSHHQRAFTALRAEVLAEAEATITVPSRLGTNWAAARSDLAARAALLASLSTDSGERAQFALIAYDSLRAIYDDPDPGMHQLLGSQQHLSKAKVAMGFALGYEWAGPLWTEPQREWVRQTISHALDQWPSLSHTNFGSQFSSNWLPVVRGAELCLMLAVGEETARPQRYRQLRGWLINNANTHGPRGWGQEGNYYLSYGQVHLLPAMLAATALGDPEMAVALQTKQHHLVPFYASMFSPNFDTLNWGVGGSIWDGGMAALNVGVAPRGEQGYARWWYDRFVGVHSTAPEADRYDATGLGRVWSILYYPEQVAPVDPTEGYPAAIEDTGGFFFRSGWTDARDVLVYLGTDRAAYSPGWDAPDALSLVVLANGQRYINGPGNTAYQATAKDLFSTILVDNAVPATGRAGGREHFALAERGAYAIATGGSAYANLGVATAQRHLLADFSGASGQTALLGLRDQLRSASGSHEYRWQINTGLAQVQVETRAGRPSFTLTYPGSPGHLRGWVIHPANADLQTASGRLFFNTQAVDADLWVVMTVGEGAAPAAAISGLGLESIVTVGGATLSYDQTADRIVTTAFTPLAPPVASFTATPSHGPAPHTVTVNAAASTSPVAITSYRWDFGDGNTATGVTAEHTYTEPGTYTVSLRLTDAAGCHEVAQRTVVAGYRWPTASFSASPSTGQPPLLVTLNAAATNHPSGLPLSYEWDFGDGSTETRASGEPFTHLFGAGTYPVRLVVRDDRGAFDAVSQTVSSANSPPVAAVSWDVGGGPAPLTVSFDGSGSSDPDADEISFLWNFGDGQTSTEMRPTHTYNTPGNFTVTLTVTDALGATAVRSLPHPITVRTLTNPVVALDPVTLPGLLRGIEYTHYANPTGTVSAYFTPDLLNVVESGVMDNFFIWRNTLPDRLAFRFGGFVDVPETGVYTFYVQSLNGSRLTVGGQQLLSDNTSMGTVNRWGTVALEAGLHPIEVLYYGNEGNFGIIPYLYVTWSGPGFDKELIPMESLYWRPGRPEAQFIFSRSPTSPVSPVLYNFDGAPSRAFGGETIVGYSWEFPGGVIKTGRTTSHSFGGGAHSVLLTVTTDTGKTSRVARTVNVPTPQSYETNGGIDRSPMPGAVVRARGEFLPNGLAVSAFDGDKLTRWLDLSLTSWIEISYAFEGQPQSYVISEYRFTSLRLWNERDPFSWKFFGSNDGENWQLIHEVTGNSFSGSHPRTNVFPIPHNTTAYSHYRFEMAATAPSSAPDGTGLNLIELIDYGHGNAPASTPPVAQWYASTLEPVVGQVVALDGTSSIDPEGYPLFYQWDFGDGQTQQGWELAEVDHVYFSPGSYEATLTVRDAQRDVASLTRTVAVTTAPNAVPVVAFTVSPDEPSGWSELTFDASASYDPDGDPITFRWDFGDGVTATGPIVSHTRGVGTFTPLLTVEDDRGGRATVAQEVVVTMPTNLPRRIGINFFGERDERYDFTWPNEIAGYLPQANWNSIRESQNELVDATGQPTLLRYVRTSTATQRNQTVRRSADHRIMRGSSRGPHRFEDVPYESYDVYVYWSAKPSASDADVFSVTLTTATKQQTTFVRQSATAWNGQYALTTAISAGAAEDGRNVMVFAGITDRTFTLSSSSHQQNLIANAVQIVDASGGANTRPVTKILGPLAGTLFDVGAAVPLRGESRDFEDGDLSGSRLVWQSNLQGVLGTGVALDLTDLQIGIHQITLTGTDSGSLSSAATITIGVSDGLQVPFITSATALTGRVGITLNYTVTASNAPTGYSAAPLPPGLSFNATTGVISGFPTIAGTYPITLRADNEFGAGSPAILVLEVLPPSEEDGPFVYFGGQMVANDRDVARHGERGVFHWPVELGGGNSSDFSRGVPWRRDLAFSPAAANYAGPPFVGGSVHHQLNIDYGNRMGTAHSRFRIGNDGENDYFWMNHNYGSDEAKWPTRALFAMLFTKDGFRAGGQERAVRLDDANTLRFRLRNDSKGNYRLRWLVEDENGDLWISQRSWLRTETLSNDIGGGASISFGELNDAANGGGWSAWDPTPVFGRAMQFIAADATFAARSFADVRGVGLHLQAIRGGDGFEAESLEWKIAEVEVFGDVAAASEGVSFAAWVAHPDRGLPAGERGPGDMPARDGLPNLLKFLLGLDPMTPASLRDHFRLAANGDDRVLHLQLNPNATGLAYVIEHSGDLGTWAEWTDAVTTTTPTDGEPTRVEVRLRNLPEGPNFFRLRVIASGG